MCGILGLFGKGESIVFQELSEGLQRLEYRGYDSCGVLLSNSQKQQLIKTLGSIQDHAYEIDQNNYDDLLALGHNRWATHGSVCKENTHPIEAETAFSTQNGVVENLQDIFLEVQYNGQTDTEVVLRFFVDLLKSYTVKNALKALYSKIKGMSAFAFVLKDEPNRCYFLRKGLSPLYISKTDNAALSKNNKITMGFCSDANILSHWFAEVYVVQDGQYGYMEKDDVVWFDDIKKISKELHEGKSKAELHGETWLYTEMQQQPEILTRAINKLKDSPALSRKYEHVCFVGCGSAYYAGCIARDWALKYGIDARAILASEFTKIEALLDTEYYKQTLFVFISQSGETLETIEAASIIKKGGYSSLGVLNAVNSSLANYVDTVMHTYAGVEVSVASTKGFTTQLMALGFLISKLNRKDGEMNQSLIEELEQVPTLMREIEFSEECMLQLLNRDVIYAMSKGVAIEITREMALKIKELGYVHTIAGSSSEFKHGSLAVVDKDFIAIIINPSFLAFDRIKANVIEIVSRGGKVIEITDQPWEKKDKNLFFWKVPKTSIITAPFVYVRCAQEIAYRIAKHEGNNIDRPRNLVKSVTVV